MTATAQPAIDRTTEWPEPTPALAARSVREHLTGLGAVLALGGATATGIATFAVPRIVIVPVLATCATAVWFAGRRRRRLRDAVRDELVPQCLARGESRSPLDRNATPGVAWTCALLCVAACSAPTLAGFLGWPSELGVLVFAAAILGFWAVVLAALRRAPVEATWDLSTIAPGRIAQVGVVRDGAASRDVRVRLRLVGRVRRDAAWSKSLPRESFVEHWSADAVPDEAGQVRIPIPASVEQRARDRWELVVLCGAASRRDDETFHLPVASADRVPGGASWPDLAPLRPDAMSLAELLRSGVVGAVVAAAVFVLATRAFRSLPLLVYLLLGNWVISPLVARWRARRAKPADDGASAIVRSAWKRPVPPAASVAVVLLVAAGVVAWLNGRIVGPTWLVASAVGAALVSAIVLRLWQGGIEIRWNAGVPATGGRAAFDVAMLAGGSTLTEAAYLLRCIEYETAPPGRASPLLRSHTPTKPTVKRAVVLWADVRHGLAVAPGPGESARVEFDIPAGLPGSAPGVAWEFVVRGDTLWGRLIESFIVPVRNPGADATTEA